MYAIQKAKQDALKVLKSAIGRGYTPSIDELETPPNEEMGDLAFPCFVLSQGMGRNPSEIASEIAAKAGVKGLVKRVESKGPYVNFWLNNDAFAPHVMKEIQVAGGKYGRSTVGREKKVMVEDANLNTHKDVHIGHVRNMVLGQTVVNVLDAAGFQVLPVAYINDLGNHVARCLWGVRHLAPDEEPPKGNENAFFVRVYVEATKRMEDDPGVREEISRIQHALESGKGEWVKLWRKTNAWSLEGLKMVFQDLGLGLKKIYLESEGLKDTKKIVQDLIKKGIVVHSDGAWVVPLEEEKLGVNLLVKSDGTHLYNAKDLALAKRKEKEEHPDRSIYVVDERQKLVMAQLFATLHKMGWKKDLFHLSYGAVSLPEGAMSTRKGNVVGYWDFRNTLVETAESGTKERHEDWKEKDVRETARVIAFAALKFSMLSSDPEKPVVFDPDKALAFEGFSGPYLLYTVARCESILRKSAEKVWGTGEGLTERVETLLVRKLAEYPEVITKTSGDYRVSRVAQYLFDIAQEFNELYAHLPILSERDEKKRQSRLTLVQSTARVLKNGLDLLGIETVDEM